MKTFLRLLTFLIFLGALTLGGGYLWLQDYTAGSGPLHNETTVLIEPGTGSAGIADRLAEAGVIEYPQVFRLAAILQKKHARFQAGEYLFEAFISPQDAMDKLASGKVVQHSLTIPEGKSSAEIVALLNAEPALSGDALSEMPPEGRLLPETYHFTRNESRQTLLKRMAEAQDDLLKELWPKRQDNLPFVTPKEALTLASIVEKETGKPEERRRVAAVYINRLRQGIALQADPTVVYGLHGGRADIPPLTYADLKSDTPYNTYIYPGLPPGPICHPGKASIAAVLDPLDTKEIFFVATGDGGHRFAETLAQHNRNVAEYRKWQRAQR